MNCTAWRVIRRPEYRDDLDAIEAWIARDNPATLTSKGRITIPQAVRAALGLRAGTKVDFVAVADGFKLVPQRNEASSLKGWFAGRLAKPVSIAAMDQAIAAEATLRNTPGKR